MNVVFAKPLPPPKWASFNLRLRWNGAAAYRNSEYGIWLEDMKTFFERIITSSRTLDIDIYFSNLGSNGPLAQCGPGNGRAPSSIQDFLDLLNDVDLYTNGTARPNHCSMIFNTYYYKEPPVTEDDRSWKRQFFTTALHECLHGCGLGSLWNWPFRIIIDNSWSTLPDWLGGGQIPDMLLTSIFDYNNIGAGNPPNARHTSGPVGSYALNDYRSQMVGQSGAGNIPIENLESTPGGRIGAHTTIFDAGGTALAHWRGHYWSTPSGIVNTQGQDRINEIFTSWSSRYEGVYRWIGRYTLGALRDIGWYVDYSPLEIAINDWRSC